MATFGYIYFAFGTILSICNFYWNVLRYPIHVALGGTRKTYRNNSGIPIFGSLFLWFSICLLPSPDLRRLAGIISIFDTSGIHWFIVWMSLAGLFPKLFGISKNKE